MFYWYICNQAAMLITLFLIAFRIQGQFKNQTQLSYIKLKLINFYIMFSCDGMQKIPLYIYYCRFLVNWWKSSSYAIDLKYDS